MLYNPEIMRHIAAQQQEDRLKEVEKARLLREIKPDHRQVMNWLNAISAAYTKLRPNKPVICSEVQIGLSKAKS